MITLLSPSKKQSEIAIENYLCSTKPAETGKANFLMDALKKLSVSDLTTIMKISDSLGKNTHEMIKKFSYKNEKALLNAIFLFEGEAFQKLDAKSLKKEDLAFAQDHLIILSALYGYLKPLDSVQNYRLDMSNSIKIADNKNLHDYWKDVITDGLNNLLLSHKNKIILNLASSEYFKTINCKKIAAKIINVDFLVCKNNACKNIGVYAKRGRGLLARYIIDKKIDLPEDIINFNQDGFEYSKSKSTPENIVFVLN